MQNILKTKFSHASGQKKFALFLDIDGILHPASRSVELQFPIPRRKRQVRAGLVNGEEKPQNVGLLDPGRQRLLADILDRHPNVDVVISSAWRNWADDPNKPQKDLTWLKNILHPTIASRIVASTPSFALGSGFARLDEIRYFMYFFAPAFNFSSAWVALDDQLRHFPAGKISPFYVEGEPKSEQVILGEEFVVIIDGENALTPLSANVLDAAIRKAEHAAQSSSGHDGSLINQPICKNSLSKADPVLGRIM